MQYKTAILAILLTAAGISAGDFKTKVGSKTVGGKTEFNKFAANGGAVGSKRKAKNLDARREQKDNSAKQDEPKKLAEFTYRKIKHVVYLISDSGEDEENVEFIKIAQKLHDGEPDANLILIDDISGLKRYVAFMKKVEQAGGGSPKNAKFPKAWAEEHILGNVGAECENDSRKWFLMLGYNHSEKIAELK